MTLQLKKAASLVISGVQMKDHFGELSNLTDSGTAFSEDHLHLSRLA